MRRRLVFVDVLSIALAVGGSQLLWFGLRDSPLATGGRVLELGLNYTLFSIILGGSWIAALAIYSTRDRRILGIGSLEYKRLFDASWGVFALVAILALLLKFDPARGYLITAFPLGLALLVLGRWGWRKWLVKKRQQGSYSLLSVLVGSRESIRYMAEQLDRFPFAGYRAIGACLPKSQIDDGIPLPHNLPILGDFSAVAEAARLTSADSVIITSSDMLPPATVRRITWSLEASNVELAIAPALTEIAGPRIHIRQLAGLPLLHVAVPSYEGSKHAAKAVFDVSVAVALTILLSPVLLILALVVGLSSRGPVIFRQERVGLNGKLFKMLKFRTMVVDAESQLDQLQSINDGAGPLFKLRDDPRVTKAGRFLRRYSLDELPQLFNVIKGDMSIVGPRPPLPREVELYEPEVRRRLLVKPGVTGPWQISGRSDLPWIEGVRLDLFYVENWSLVGDLVLIWRTLRAVLRREGAY
jgi:exopolysaccharide biosynthesis polyprenyl glycosylphosphotransferase